jgi:hypothetical protein
MKLACRTSKEGQVTDISFCETVVVEGEDQNGQAINIKGPTVTDESALRSSIFLQLLDK